jgi:hypothetical protein
LAKSVSNFFEKPFDFELFETNKNEHRTGAQASSLANVAEAA